MKTVTIRDSIELEPATQETFRQIFQGIIFAKKNQKCIAFCSDSQEVSSRLLPLQLAAAIADESKRIAVINTGVQCPAFDQRADRQGLTDYLSGHCELAEIIYETDFPQVDFIPGGTADMNPLLLQGEDLQSIFTLCREKYDWVLVNTGPLSAHSMNTAKFAQFCDGAVLIARDHRTNKKWLEAAKTVFDAAGCPVEGCIVVDARRSKAYSKA